MSDQISLIEGILARVQGPMSFRFIIQPVMAIIFAIRDGGKDAKAGNVPYFWALFTDAEHRHDLLANGWKSIGKVFIIAILLDLVFQYIALHDFRPVGALIAGILLAVIPYLLIRGPVNRIIRGRRHGGSR